jgi:hypothetical protein
MGNPAQWTIELTEEQRDELATQASAAARAGYTITTLARAHLPLASLRPAIDAAVTALRDGRGFVLIRGFPYDELDALATELGYLGLGLHLGNPVGQDSHGTLLGHVRDEGLRRSGPHIRLYQTHERQDFHTDGADLVGLLCLQGADSGGESKLASAYAVYNYLLDTRPDLLDELYQPLPWDRNDEQAAGEPPFFVLPPITDIDRRPRIFYIGWYITDAQRHPDAPRLTSAQREAMALLEHTANDPAFHVAMDFQPGDIQLVANATILHAREAYTDSGDPSRRRHLLRLWLKASTVTAAADIVREGIPARDG